jgi:RNA polymerase sigma-70 factor, ECF subfamily
MIATAGSLLAGPRAGGALHVADARARELELVLSAQGGSREAFAELVRTHQRRAYAVARAIVLDHHDAEDAVQDGFLHAYRALARFRPGEPFGAWLHRIVANAALDLQRRRKVRSAGVLPETIALPFRDPAESDELRRRLSAALERLSERQRAVIVLHDVEGFRHAEIGEMLGIPEGTARSDLHHARAALRRILSDTGSEP